MHALRPFLLASAVILMAGGPALAETCRDEAERIATQYNLQWPKPPMTVESRGLTEPEEMAAAEVGEAPEGEGAAATKPAEDQADVPTTPEIESPPTSEAAQDLTPEERERMEALLLEAVKAEEAGDSEACFKRLDEAKVVPSE